MTDVGTFFGRFYKNVNYEPCTKVFTPICFFVTPIQFLFAYHPRRGWNKASIW